MKQQHNYKRGYRKREPRLEDELVASLLAPRNSMLIPALKGIKNLDLTKDIYWKH